MGYACSHSHQKILSLHFCKRSPISPNGCSAQVCTCKICRAGQAGCHKCEPEAFHTNDLKAFHPQSGRTVYHTEGVTCTESHVMTCSRCSHKGLRWEAWVSTMCKLFRDTSRSLSRPAFQISHLTDTPGTRTRHRLRLISESSGG